MLRNTKCRAAAGSYKLRVANTIAILFLGKAQRCKLFVIANCHLLSTNDCEVFLQFFVLAIRYLPFVGCWLFVEAALGVGLFYLLEFLPT